MPATGPTTSEGKALASRNSLRHGLYSTVIVCISGEDEDEWQLVHDGVLEALAPANDAEVMLASRAAALFWRLRRAAAVEAAMFDRHLTIEAEAVAHRIEKDERLRRSLGESNFYGGELPASRESAAPPDPLPDEAALNRLIRMESHVNRQLLHTLHELESLQERRQGRPAPLARVDVHGLPGA